MNEGTGAADGLSVVQEDGFDKKVSTVQAGTCGMYVGWDLILY
jgi:hypothetical protein